MEKKRKYYSNSKILVSVFAIIIGITILVITLFNNYIHTKVNSDNVEQLLYVYDKISNEYQEVKPNKKINKLKELQRINGDIIGLIEIVGTNINYPVVQGKDNSYYMNHNYKKEKSRDGAVFLDKDYNWQLPSTNLLIYGHNNIGSTQMFVELVKYKKESFYKEHKIINFTTAEEEARYEIISVFLSRVYYKNETNVFRYYYFINANSKIEFDNFINDCKKVSLYNIEATAKYGDQLMTLSTCEYSKKNGRLAVVARKITE